MVVCCDYAEEMKPALKPRVPRPAEKPSAKNSRESVTPHDEVVMRTKGHCIYDLKELFAITLVSVCNVNVVDFSLVRYLFISIFVN